MADSAVVFFSAYRKADKARFLGFVTTGSSRSPRLRRLSGHIRILSTYVALAMGFGAYVRPGASVGEYRGVLRGFAR